MLYEVSLSYASTILQSAICDGAECACDTFIEYLSFLPENNTYKRDEILKDVTNLEPEQSIERRWELEKYTRTERLITVLALPVDEGSKYVYRTHHSDDCNEDSYMYFGSVDDIAAHFDLLHMVRRHCPIIKTATFEIEPHMTVCRLFGNVKMERFTPTKTCVIITDDQRREIDNYYNSL